MIGARLGPYEITAKLGEGGMGEVYRATDTKLKRDVAIRVLPERSPRPARKAGSLGNHADAPRRMVDRG